MFSKLDRILLLIAVWKNQNVLFLPEKSILSHHPHSPKSLENHQKKLQSLT
jgi:hypothetical protein